MGWFLVGLLLLGAAAISGNAGVEKSVGTSQTTDFVLDDGTGPPPPPPGPGK